MTKETMTMDTKIERTEQTDTGLDSCKFCGATNFRCPTYQQHGHCRLASERLDQLMTHPERLPPV